MKKLLFLSIIVLACKISLAQNTITNNTPCPIAVEQVCIDPLASCSTTYSSGFLPVAASGGFIAIPATCASGEETYFNIIVTSPYCSTTPTVTVAGDNGGSALCGTPLQVDMTTQQCEDCFFTGFATATYTPATNTLDITH